MARVALLEKETAHPRVREMFEKMEAGGYQVLNVYKAVAHAPTIGPDILRLGNKILMKGKLSPKLREFAILRIGDLANASYEFTKHVHFGEQAGISRAQIDALPHWERSELFDEHERAVLAYTDEVSRTYRARDETFAALRRFLDDQEIVELTIAIGYYEMMCRLLEALQIELEDEEFQTF